MKKMNYLLSSVIVIFLLLTGCSEKNLPSQSPSGLDPSNYAESKLCEAAENGDMETVKILLEQGANVNEKGKFDATALWFASLGGHSEIVKLLLANDAYLEAKDSQWGETPFKLAAEMGHMEIAGMLLEKGAYPYRKNKMGTTALMAASLRGHTEMVKLLLDIGADLSTKDQAGKTALHYASQKGQTEVIEILADKGADIEARSGLGDAFEESVTPRPGVTVTTVSRNDPPLILATVMGEAEAVKVLIEKGADVNFKGRQNRTALHMAAIRGQAAVVKVLVEKGIDVNARDDFGKTALHYASIRKNREIKEILLENGAE